MSEELDFYIKRENFQLHHVFANYFLNSTCSYVFGKSTDEKNEMASNEGEVKF